MRFWGVSHQYDIQNCIKELQTTIFDLEPGKEASEDLKKIWRKVGKFDLAQIYEREGLEIDSSLKNVYGVMFDDSDIYYGQVGKNGKFSGFSRLYSKNGKRMWEGQLVDNNLNGYSRFLDEKQCWYEGYFKNGQKHGYGKFTFSTGGIQ